MGHRSSKQVSGAVEQNTSLLPDLKRAPAPLQAVHLPSDWPENGLRWPTLACNTTDQAAARATQEARNTAALLEAGAREEAARQPLSSSSPVAACRATPCKRCAFSAPPSHYHPCQKGDASLGETCRTVRRCAPRPLCLRTQAGQYHAVKVLAQAVQPSGAAPLQGARDERAGCQQQARFAGTCADAPRWRRALPWRRAALERGRVVLCRGAGGQCS